MIYKSEQLAVRIDSLSQPSLLPRYVAAISETKCFPQLPLLVAVLRTAMPYKIETSALKDEDFETRPHPLDPAAIRSSFPLGDKCGLTKLGVNLVRLPPHSKSSTLHWHSHDDEWVYVLEAGESSGTLLTLPDGEKEPREETIRAGDFIAFPANTRLGHVICSGDSEVIFLCSGTRESVDVCTYPLAGKKLVIDRSASERWYTDVANVTHQKM